MKNADPNVSDEILETVLTILNDAVARDREAIEALLFDHRVFCNASLADHPTIQVKPEIMHARRDVFSLGSLGLLNGIIQALTGEKIAATVDVTGLPEGVRGKLVGFVKYRAPTTATVE